MSSGKVIIRFYVLSGCPCLINYTLNPLPFLPSPQGRGEIGDTSENYEKVSLFIFRHGKSDTYVYVWEGVKRGSV
jgi:hypothetical protein